MSTREEELTGQGWQKKSTIDEPRLSELVQAYRRIGYEVHLEPFDPSEESGCSDCLKAAPEKTKTIYVRESMADDACDTQPF